MKRYMISDPLLIPFRTESQDTGPQALFLFFLGYKIIGSTTASATPGTPRKPAISAVTALRETV
jgi:hypothetical protein